MVLRIVLLVLPDKTQVICFPPVTTCWLQLPRENPEGRLYATIDKLSEIFASKALMFVEYLPPTTPGGIVEVVI
jgi:hypothetical protein